MLEDLIVELGSDAERLTAPEPARPVPEILEASASDSDGQIAGSPLNPFIVLSNAVGDPGLAAAWRTHLTKAGQEIDSLVNQSTFGLEDSRLLYAPIFEDAARELASHLPFPIEMAKASPGTIGDIRIELGGDAAFALYDMLAGVQDKHTTGGMTL